MFRMYERKVSVPIRNVLGVAVAVVPELAADQVSDPQVAWFDDVLACLAAGVTECAGLGDPVEVPDAVRIDRIARLEKIKAAAAALQMAESVRFAQSQAAVQLAADVHPDQIGRGIADQLGLACRISGFEAARRLGVARALWFDLPETYRLLVVGEISQYVASLVVTETRHLDARTRRDVDAKISTAGISQMGPRSAAACARKHAYEADPEGYVQRGRTERMHRRVTLQPPPGHDESHDQDHHPTRSYLSEPCVTAVRVNVLGCGGSRAKRSRRVQSRTGRGNTLLRSIRGTRSHIDSGWRSVECGGPIRGPLRTCVCRWRPPCGMGHGQSNRPPGPDVP